MSPSRPRVSVSPPLSTPSKLPAGAHAELHSRAQSLGWGLPGSMRKPLGERGRFPRC